MTKIYLCSHCDYKSEVEQNTIRHLNRKNKCNKDAKLIIRSVAKPECMFCGSKMVSLAVLRDHVMNHCKKTTETDKKNYNSSESNDILLKKKIASLENDIIVMKDSYNELMNELKEMKKMMMDIKNMGDKRYDSHDNITNNNINNNININVTIDGESITYYKYVSYNELKEDEYKRILKKSIDCVPSLIQKVHFNNIDRSNHNMYIDNLDSKYMYIYENKKWIPCIRNSIIEDLIRSCHLALDYYVDMIKDEEIINIYKKYKKNYDINYDEYNNIIEKFRMNANKDYDKYINLLCYYDNMHYYIISKIELCLFMNRGKILNRKLNLV